MTTPPTIKEEDDGHRWIVDNARPRSMRVAIGMVAPVVLAFIGLAMVNDVREHKWWMLAARVLFAALVVMSAVFSLFGGESLALEGAELVWRRGRSQERRCAVADVVTLERVGNHLRIFARGDDKHPAILVGAGLRQPPAAVAWLLERLQDALARARSG
jgi:hypothetical protein